ncbi:MAG: hypothetical protein M3525_08370 [Acidobacteriota bacterium]|nr:hypothetical protein [Acidobacteriota bacterium]
MDLEMILIFLGFVLCGVIVASPVAYALGQRHILEMLDSNSADILEAEVLEERR